MISELIPSRGKTVHFGFAPLDCATRYLLVDVCCGMKKFESLRSARTTVLTAYGIVGPTSCITAGWVSRCTVQLTILMLKLFPYVGYLLGTYITERVYVLRYRRTHASPNIVTIQIMERLIENQKAYFQISLQIMLAHQLESKPTDQ